MATINRYGGSIDLLMSSRRIEVKIILPSDHPFNQDEMRSLLLNIQIGADRFSQEFEGHTGKGENINTKENSHG